MLWLHPGGFLDSNEFFANPLNIAIHFGYYEMAALLLKLGFNSKIYDEKYEKPTIFNAIKKGSLDLVDLLLQKDVSLAETVPLQLSIFQSSRNSTAMVTLSPTLPSF